MCVGGGTNSTQVILEYLFFFFLLYTLRLKKNELQMNIKLNLFGVFAMVGVSFGSNSETRNSCVLV